MFGTVRRFLATPNFADEDKSRVAGLVNFISLSFLILSVVGSLFLLVVAKRPAALGGGILFVGLEALVQILMRRGRVRLAGIVQTSLLWLIITVFILNGGGVRAVTFSSYILVVILASLFLGRYWGAGTAGLSIVSGVLMIYLENQKSPLLRLYTEPPQLLALGVQATHFVVAAVLIGVVVYSIESALGRARLSNQDLQETQAALEQRIKSEEEQRQALQHLMQSELEQREHLQNVLVQVRTAAGNLGSSSTEILAATNQQAAGAGEQSAAISQTSTTIDEVRAIADQTAVRAQGVAQVAQRTAEVSHSGQQAVAQSISGMREVKAQVDAIAQTILSLSEQVQAISQIIATVKQISTQSNLLALNAAVEAARAGEAGKGFAVVAGEVRALAERSRSATEQVRDLLSEIQLGVNIAVAATEEGIKGSDIGMRLAGEAGQSIRELAENANESAQAAAQIVAAANQQVTGMEQIAGAMKNILQVTSQTLASAHQSERTAEELNRLAGQLQAVVEQYRQ